MSLLWCRQVYETEKDVLGDNRKAIALAAIAAFTLSLVTKHKFRVLSHFSETDFCWFCYVYKVRNSMMDCSFFLQKSIYLLKYIIASEWIGSDGLKPMISPLHNVGVFLWRNHQIKEVKVCLCLFFLTASPPALFVKILTIGWL